MAPKGQIDFNTVQKLEYKLYDFKPRIQPFKFEDNHQVSLEPFNGLTSYYNDFKPTGSLHFPKQIKRNPNEVTMRLPGTLFTSKTTNNEHYQDWENKQPARGYNEHPSYVGSALFPTAERNFETSTNKVHDLKKIPKAQKRMETKGTLAVEGNMEFNTCNRDTFVNYPDFKMTQKIVPVQNEALKPKGKLKAGVSQNSVDFVFHAEHRPPRPADCNPYLSKIENDIYPGNG